MKKAMAAYRGGVNTVYIPKDNLADLDEVDSLVLEKVKFVPVSFVSQIIDCVLEEVKTDKKSGEIYYTNSSQSANRVSQ